MHTLELKTSNGCLYIKISTHQRNSIFQLQFSGYNSYKIGDYISGYFNGSQLQDPLMCMIRSIFQK